MPGVYKNVFRNELDNKITVKIKKVKTTGTTHKTGETHTYAAVNIQLIGPTSTSEQTITYKEAKELHDGLAAFLGPPTPNI